MSSIPPAVTPSDLVDAQIVFERTPVEELIDKHVMIDGEWTIRPFILLRGPDGMTDRPATGTQAALETTLMEHRNARSR